MANSEAQAGSIGIGICISQSRSRLVAIIRGKEAKRSTTIVPKQHACMSIDRPAVQVFETSHRITRKVPEDKMIYLFRPPFVASKNRTFFFTTGSYLSMLSGRCVRGRIIVR